MQVSNEIKEFIKGKQRFPNSRWFVIGNVGSVYLRRGVKNIKGDLMNLITIAAIQIEEKHRGKGIFKVFVKELRECLIDTEYIGIYFECVHNEILQKYFTRHGWNSDCTYLEEIGITEHNYWIEK